MSLMEWETLKAEQLAKALAAVKASPDDAEAAIRLHGALVAFGQPGEAKKLGDRMRERFAQDARTQVYLASISESEVVTGSAASALPPRRVRLWPTFAAAAAIAGGVIMALVAVFGSNYYISQHRSLHLVNGLNQAVSVNVAGRGSVTVGRQGWRELELPEGAYRATVRGAVTQTVDFVVAAHYFDRWL